MNTVDKGEEVPIEADKSVALSSGSSSSQQNMSVDTQETGPTEQSIGTTSDRSSPEQLAEPETSAVTAPAQRRKLSALEKKQLTPEQQMEELIGNLSNLPPDTTPLLALKYLIESFFSFGSRAATIAYRTLRSVADSRVQELVEPNDRILVDIDIRHASPKQNEPILPWTSSHQSATLILLFACAVGLDGLSQALSVVPRSLNDLPTLSIIRNTPSVSLLQAYNTAKQVATGPEKRTTVLQVSLVDLLYYKLAEHFQHGSFTSFAHDFTFGVGPEGVIVWQSWGNRGDGRQYGLDKYLKCGAGDVHSWNAAEQFVADFMKLVAFKRQWDTRRNKIYRKLFHVDLLQLCGPNGPLRQLPPRFEPWVKIHVVEDVKVNDVGKFAWKMYGPEAKPFS